MYTADDLREGKGIVKKTPKYNSILPYLKSKQVVVVKKGDTEEKAKGGEDQSHD